jgi:kynureninase
MEFQIDRQFALEMDAQDTLSHYRDKFHFPVNDKGQSYLYFCGNSLGLQPVTVKESIEQELDDWKKYGVEGHLHAKHPWLPYHEFLTQGMATIVGAKPHEVVMMNTLSVNLHLMMVSFYRPSKSRYKILIEHDAFPSDKYAVASQVRFHGFDPSDAIIELKARPGEYTIREEDIEAVINGQGQEIALIMIGNTNYYTGQYFNMKAITELGHKQGSMVGFDCAHGAGNIPLELHNSGADFAVWCSYKYLNSGPGSVAGCFVHERHAADSSMPRFEGWWGHNKETRFGMRDAYDPIYGVEAWQLSNPPILSLAAIKASVSIFESAGIYQLREKSIKLTAYLEYLIHSLENININIITPSDPAQRGAQLSIQITNADKAVYDKLILNGVIADWRSPDVIRVAPAPLYNSYLDVYEMVQILKKILP